MGLTQSSEDGLKISNAGTNGQYLQKQSGNTGGLTWADVPAGVGGATGVDFNDNVKARFGTGNDLEILHDGSNSYIQEDGTGQIIIRGWSPRIQAGYSPSSSRNTGEDAIVCITDGAVELYYDAIKKFQTESWGASFFDDVKFDNPDNAGKDVTWIPASDLMRWQDDTKATFGDGDDLELSHNGSTSFITDGIGDLRIRSDALKLQSAGGENYVHCTANGAVQIHYDNVKKFETKSYGCNLVGNLHMTSADNQILKIGTGDDLQIYHDGSHSYIKDDGTGDLFIRNGSDDAIRCRTDGSVELFYDNANKLKTVSDGVQVTGKLGVGIVPTRQLQLHVTDSGSAHALFTNGDTGGTSSDGFLVGLDSAEEGKIWQHEDKGITIGTNNAQRIYIQNGGHICFGKDSTSIGTNGQTFLNNGEIWITRDNGIPFSINRKTSDGQLVRFHGDGANEGNISISGSTISYNGGHLSRWSQFKGISQTDKSVRPTIYQGTVLSNLDDLCQWDDSSVNQQLNMTKVSDVDGDKNVAGVFWTWDDDPDDTVTNVNDFYIAMTGDMVIRVAASTAVALGDLLISAGDGTAKPQADDIIRSSTIAKIISTNSTATYADGSKAYPCVLMAC